MIQTKQKYITFNNQEFDTLKEAEDYENSHVDERKKYEVIWELNRIFSNPHKNDNDEEEHCIFSGKLCNKYEQETSCHNGDYYRGDLKKVVTPNHHIFDRCMTEKKAHEFMKLFKELVNKLYD